MCATRRVTNVDLWFDSDFCGVAFGERFNKSYGVLGFDEVHCAASEASAGESRTDETRDRKSVV